MVQKKNDTFNVRFSYDELELLKSFCFDYNLSVSHVIRTFTIEGIKKRRDLYGKGRQEVVLETIAQLNALIIDLHKLIEEKEQ